MAVPLVRVESLRVHTYDHDDPPHEVGTTYQVPADQLESLRVQRMAIPPRDAQVMRQQIQDSDDWYANEAGLPMTKRD